MSEARCIQTRRIYQGRVLALDVDEVEEPDGLRVVREVVRHCGSVAALPVLDDGRIVLVRQYRYPVDAHVWELPAGRRDPGETPDAAVRRELEEETGLRAGVLEPLSVYFTSPGFLDEVMHLFRATKLTRVAARPESDERITCGTFSLGEVQAMIARGEICEAKTLIALQLEADIRRKAP